MASRAGALFRRAGRAATAGAIERSRVARCVQARHFASTSSLADVCSAAIKDMKSAGTFKTERVITSMQRSSITCDGTGDKEILNFCSNNYLGLCDNRDIMGAAKATIDSHGFGMSSVRFICGTQDIHKKLEAELADFHGMEDAILFPSGFDANAGFFEAVLGPEDAIISDSLNHASIIDGIRLCKASRYRYDHMDMESLEERLREAGEKGARLKVIVTDGVFSMDGDVAPLKEIRALADKHNAYIYVDDCHATGFIGATGRGTPELAGVKVDFVSTTLGKALGGATGGYLTSSKEVVSVLRNKARTYLFTNTVAPCVVGASRKAVEMIRDPVTAELVQRLKDNTHYIREAFREAGLSVLGHDDCPIVPVFLGDAKLAKSMSEKLLERGVLAIAFSYPVVPQGGARIRFQISAAHSKEQLQKCVSAVIGASKELGEIELSTTKT